MIGPRPMCMDCTHLLDDNEEAGTFICKAYPKGIPEDILNGLWDHREPFAGQDNDITFESNGEGLEMHDATEPADKADCPECLITAPAKFELVVYTGNEDVDAVLFADAMVNKAFTRKRGQEIVDVLLQVSVPDSFAALNPAQAKVAMDRLISAMTQAGGWSVSGVVEQLKKAFPSVDDFQLRRIVRTESTRIATKAQELEAVENDPVDTHYQWRGPRDRRTCPAHQWILDNQAADGYSMEGLKVFIATAAAQFGLTVVDDFLIHPNQRGGLKRLFKPGGA